MCCKWADPFEGVETLFGLRVFRPKPHDSCKPPPSHDPLCHRLHRRLALVTPCIAYHHFDPTLAQFKTSIKKLLCFSSSQPFRFSVTDTFHWPRVLHSMQTAITTWPCLGSLVYIPQSPIKSIYPTFSNS
jgi:hypothetical protein